MDDHLKQVVKLYVVRLGEDDPRKCTSAKLIRFGFAQPVKINRIPNKSVLLDPYANKTLTLEDGERVNSYGLTALDCSWKNVDKYFTGNVRGHRRRLPSLLAGNPTNYSQLGKLTSLEAFAAALYITTRQSIAMSLLSLYKWGETFLTLNYELLERYKTCKNEAEIGKVEKDMLQ